jgi:hypothetical protein
MKRTAVAASLALAAAAHAQLNTVDGPYFGAFANFGSAGNMVNQNQSSVGGLVNTTMGLQYFGDWSWSMPRADGNATIDSYSVIKFGVGPLPVQVSNFNFVYNAKWVNGGGNSTLPATSINLFGAIKEQLGTVTNPSTDPTILGLGITDGLTGNGLRILNSSASGGSSNPILAVGRTYYLYIDDNTSINVTGFGPFTPSITVTNEYGGALSSPTFTGFNAYFTGTVVPAPCAGGILSLVALSGLRRRRRV